MPATRRFTSILVLVAYTLALLPRPVYGISAEGLVGMASVQGVLIAVANVNRAMRDAAENPMDQWRRNNVAIAIRAMPPAIIALAKDFESGKLHDKDFPMVQQMLGGFVDVNAAKGYEKFLKSPSKDLIPQVGAGFPQQYLASAGPSNASVVFDDGASKGAAPQAGSVFAKKEPVSEFKAKAEKGIDDKQDEALASLRVTFDDDKRKGPAPATNDGQGNRAAGSDTLAGSEGLSQGTLERLESLFGAKPAAPKGSVGVRSPASELTTTPIIRSGEGLENALDEDFFQKPKKKQPKAQEPQARYRLKVQPKYWQVVSILRLMESALIPYAHAEGGGCGGDCGGGGEGGGGGQAAQALFGIAAIISAIAPMVVAGIQAEAEKDVARTNAKAQIEMTNITAATSKFLSNQQTKVAMDQAERAERINQRNQDAVTERLEAQLAEIRLAREDAAQRERERIAEEKRLNEERIALAKKQADDNLKLARQTLNAQLTQAGLTSGFGNSKNSGGGLTGTNLTGTTAVASTASNLSGTTIANSASGQAFTNSDYSTAIEGNARASSGGLGINLSPSTAGNALVSNSLGNGGNNGSNPAPSASVADRLVASGVGTTTAGRGVSGTSVPTSPNGQPMVYDQKSGMFVPQVTMEMAAKGAVPGPARGVTGRKVQGDTRQLASLMGSSHRGIRGSSAGNKVQITARETVALSPAAAGESGDLADFRNSGGGFSAYVKRGGSSVRVIEQNPTSGISAEDLPPLIPVDPNAYNPPLPSAGGHSGNF